MHTLVALHQGHFHHRCRLSEIFFCRLLSLSLCLVVLLQRIGIAQAFTLNMVEGHSVHRIASRFRSQLVGKKFAATSPNGRFLDGSRAIDNRVLSRMEAVGKNLFAFFTPDANTNGPEAKDDVVVHVHFGMSGAWSVFDYAKEPDVKPTTRLRLEEVGGSQSSTKLITHLSAMTVQHGDVSLYTSKKAALGQDPLRLDADPDALWTKVKKSKKSIGQIIMDQSFFAGPGNIYRAEILFLAGIYPTVPGMELDRASFDRVWDISVKLLRRGYETGSILTVDPKTDPDLARHERRYIYNKSTCSRCYGPIRSWDMSGRTCYACEGTCQPKTSAAAAPTSPKKGKTSKAVKEEVSSKITPEKDQHVPFISHCAPVDVQKRLKTNWPDGLTVKEIRAVLEQMVGADALPPKSARKATHVEALSAALAMTEVKAIAALPPPMISAEDAAREKASAGEGRNVEHIAELSREQAIEAVATVTPSPAVSKKSKRSHRKRSAVPSTSSASDDTRRRLNYD